MKWTSTCDQCGEPAVVEVNGRKACAEHIDDVMAAAFAPVREALHRMDEQ